MNDNIIQPAASAYSYPLTIRNLFNAPVVDSPCQEIVYRGEERFTYAEFRKRVHRLANMLFELGVRPGDTVAVMDWDSHRYLECFYAVPMMGAVLHTVNIRLSPDQILYTIDHAEDDFILVNQEFLPMLDQIRERIDTVREYILISDGYEAEVTPSGFAGEYEQLLAKADELYEFPELDENTRATTFYTTGTTGLPKGVYFSHRQLVLHTLGGMAALGTVLNQGRMHQEDVYMPITPMFHVHAWGVPYMATSLGLKQVYPGKYVPAKLLDLIEQEGVTFSHCVPTILHLLMHHPRFSEVDLSNWKVMIGGAALPRAMCREAMKRGIDIYSGYGMSETCPILTISHVTERDLEDDKQCEVRCMTGRPLPLVQLRIVNEEMESLPDDGQSVGEIVVRAPWLTQGYLKDPDNSEKLWQGGWLHTGDVAWSDSRRYVKITDRIKDVIKAGGEWISSLQVEDILITHPAVKEVAVIGIPDDKWGEVPLALVIPHDDAGIKEKELRQYVKEFVDKGVVSRQVVLLKVRLVDEIDKTSVGKINKRVLREKYASNSQT